MKHDEDRQARGGIAIVGMACRYPGARSPAELWDNVLAGRREFRRLPAERLRLEDYLADPAHSADPPDPDSVYSTEAAVLEGWEFDRVRFQVSGSLYRAADLAHWLALETAAAALDDAGFPAAAGLPRDAAGVLLGNTLTGEFSRAQLLRQRWPYVRRVLAAALARQGWEAGRLAEFLRELEPQFKAPFPEPTEESLAGGLSNTIAGRICNHFDLHGGGYTLDGACASSLLAVANACSALAAGDLDAALAGGVDLSLDPFELVGFARTGALAREEMRVYDARSAGFFPGEGCGFVVLLRERDAIERGCPIYAVIRGWGISSDGHGGISRPEAAGQQLALARAYRRAGFGIGSVGYFEGHGTGTAVGDSTELAALAAALGEAGEAGKRAPAATPPAALGSIKGNFGHTKAAAGVAGLIKATLALHHQLLPPQVGCDEPHPALAAAGDRLRVLARGEVWPAGRPLRAGVSAMGFGGINTHVALEGMPVARRSNLTPRERVLLASAQESELFLLAAPDRAALAGLVDRLLELAPRLSRSELVDLAAALQARLRPGAARAALIARTPRELADRLARLRQALAGPPAPMLAPRHGVWLGDGDLARRIGFLFTGQGSPPPLSGGALARRFPALADLYDREIVPPGEAADTRVAQPAIVLHSLAALALLDRLGIRADVGVGHSLGEISALAWAGAFDPETAMTLARERGRAMAALDASRPGSMASLAAPAAEVEGLLAECGPGAVIAACNGPARTVVSGETAAVEAVMERARRQGFAATRLQVSHAFHSPLMAAAAGRLAEALAALEAHPPGRPVASTVTGALLGIGEDLRALLVRQLTAPVRFSEALAAARGLADFWIEVGPGRSLAQLAEQALGPALGPEAAPALALDAGGSDLTGLLEVAAQAHALGVPLATEALFSGRFSRPFDLERPLRFLANPCESAAVEAPAVGVAVAARRASAPVASREETATETAAGAESPLDLLRRLVAQRAELPPEAVRAESRLLADLHLNSIAVGQLVADAAQRLGRVPPASPTDFARATVGEAARALAEQPALGSQGSAGAEAGVAPPGVEGWVRPFTVALVERPLPRRGGEESPRRAWHLVARPDHPLREALEAALQAAGGGGVALCLPAGAAEPPLELFLETARRLCASPTPAALLVVQEDGGGAAFARTAHLELPEMATVVVDLPFAAPRAAAWVTAEAAAARGYGEVSYDALGTRRVPVLRLLDPEALPRAAALGEDDVLLATGGGKGITAECALELARASRARLALVGRSSPGRDAELAANLERLRSTGVRVAYAAADVTDAAAVRAAVRALESELGPVTAVLHGAGVNSPRLLAALDREGFARTVEPKLAGLRHVLAAVDRGRLRLLVALGSIIARTGLRGESEYAVANEWLGREVERFGREHPGCRCLALESSVWAGVGMGERLGAVESLLRQGITPIPTDAGTAALRRLVECRPPASTVVLTGRFGDPPTVELERPELPLLRFLERPRVYVPGVELIADAEVSAATDPHLPDHVFRGEPLLAAVFGLEAMAQAARALDGGEAPPVFERIEWLRPVAVQPGRSTTLRVAALRRAPGLVEVVVRHSTTGFLQDHFRALCRRAPAAHPPLGEWHETADEPAALALDPQRDLYGGLLFHRGRFRRLERYRRLRATECRAEILPDGAVTWFDPRLPGELLLGDPGARDAAIHGIQACIPHAQLLPIGAARIACDRLPSHAPLSLRAREISRQGAEFVYDLEILGADGAVRERWDGLRLRAVDRPPAPRAWSAGLLAPWVERRVADLVPGAAVRVALDPTAGDPLGGGGAALLRHLLGAGATLRHRPDGKPEVDPVGGWHVSLAHAAPLLLAVAAERPVGCDLEPVVDRPEETWRSLLGEERYRLAEAIAAGRGETRDAAATRVWTAVESLTKGGAPHAAPLVLEEAAAGEPDGWLVLRSGRLRIASLVAPLHELAGEGALSVLVETAEADVARL